MSEESVESVEVGVTEDVMAENGPNPMIEMVRKVLLASIGAVALTQEEVEKVVNKLIERGEIAEKDGRKLVKDLMEKRRKKATEVKDESEEEFEKRMEEVLARMNIASKSDVDSINRKLTTLSKKLDDLNK
ncbi:MAG: phasin family protein [Chloroflexota bacterium]|jgi:poly(hydroxyalkanoate) granule-associated protein